MNKLDFNSKMSYFLGARYKHGKIPFTDDKTGEVKKVIEMDKWRLFFISPINMQENIVTEGFGTGISYFDVENKDLCFLLGKSEKDFKLDDLKALVNQAVILDIANTANSNGKQIAYLRGIMSVDDFIKSMTEKK